MLSPIHTKNDNYKDKVITHIVRAHLSAALNSRARYSKMDSDWCQCLYCSSAGKKIILKVILTISFVCAFIVIAMPFFNIESDF